MIPKFVSGSSPFHTMNIAIIYHDADFDGKLSNEVCRFHLKQRHPDAAIHSYGWDYGRRTPIPEGLYDEIYEDPKNPRMTVSFEWADYDAIYIVDLNVPELMERAELMEKIVWIDHHKSAIEKWEVTRKEFFPGWNFKGIRLDGVAACRLCWFYFYNLHLPESSVTKRLFVDRVVSEPRLIRLAGEYDIWDHRDPDAKALQFGLRALSQQDMDLLIRNQFCGVPTGVRLDDVITQGHSIKCYCDAQNAHYATYFAHTVKWEGLTFCCINSSTRNSDAFLGAIKPEHDACFLWRYTPEFNAVTVSLYHAPGNEHHDMSKIAVKYKGGGHKGACGFRITLGKLEEILNGGVV
jgi:hypothetical protein